MSFMPLYEVEQKFLSIIDEETGEIKCSEEEFDELCRNEANGVEYFIRLYKNQKALADALKAEEDYLAKRRKTLENSNKRILERLDNHMQGNKFECVSGSINYRKSQTAEQTNEMAFLTWDGRFGFGTSEFKADKMAIKTAIKEGKEIPGWTVTEKLNASIK